MTNQHTEPITTTSADINEERLVQLRQLFPEAFTEGKVDFDKLRATLGDLVDNRPERYSFTWAGKQDAIRILQTPTSATLIPAPDESVDFNNTQNIFIEGDNLEVLKLLYKAYFGRVKMIYIDPPYNTGKDFIYPDNYADPLDTYMRLTGQKDAEGNLLTTNSDTSGRYHSAWLNMMYPRLFLARQLLRADGVIFISIDDNELHNLRLVMNEIFGEENFYGVLAWQKKDTPSNDAKGISENHEYIIIYTRGEEFIRGLFPRTDAQLANYKNPDNDPRGPWTRTALIRKEYVEKDFYPIKNPQGEDIYPPSGTSWRVSKGTLKRLIEEDRLWWGINNDGKMPFVKRFLSEVQEGVVPVSWWDYKFAGSNRNAKTEIRELFDRAAPFETPKPSQLIKRLLKLANDEEAIVLDFFAGSATTAHSVLELNRKDNGSRRFILVQLPEPTDAKSTARKEGFSTVSDIGKERIRKVINRLLDEDKGKLPLDNRDTPEDLGFKVFKLAPTNFRAWEGTAEATPEKFASQMELFNDPLVDGWRPANVICEISRKEG